MLSINKLNTLILAALENAYASASAAASRAHETATGSESIAENKYDTFGLEASYLAHGQSMRAAQCRADIEAFRQLFATADLVGNAADIALLNNDIANTDPTVAESTSTEFISQQSCNKQRQVRLGRVVVLVDEDDKRQYLFVGPSAGGLKIHLDGIFVLIVTPASPLGAAVMNKCKGEEFCLNIGGVKRYFDVVWVS
ncbi:GreA/GreB family elongation factor [Shewanella sp. 125m-7]